MYGCSRPRRRQKHGERKSERDIEREREKKKVLFEKHVKAFEDSEVPRGVGADGVGGNLPILLLGKGVFAFGCFSSLFFVCFGFSPQNFLGKDWHSTISSRWEDWRGREAEEKGLREYKLHRLIKLVSRREGPTTRAKSTFKIYDIGVTRMRRLLFSSDHLHLPSLSIQIL